MNAFAPEPPVSLPDAQRRYWDQITAILVTRGTWDESYGLPVAVLADSVATYFNAMQRLAEEGEVLLSPRGTGELVKHPYVTVKGQAFERISKLLPAFGLTLASLKALKLDQPQTPTGDDDLLE